MGRRHDARVPGYKRGLTASAVAGGAFIAVAGLRYGDVASMREVVLLAAVGLVLLGIGVHGLFAGIQRRLARPRPNGVAFRA